MDVEYVIMICTDTGRHELLAGCTHRDSVMTLVKMADGCSGRLCADCQQETGIRHWPGVADRISGSAAGLDVLEIFRAAVRRW